jgi:hypothetical protein
MNSLVITWWKDWKGFGKPQTQDTLMAPMGVYDLNLLLALSISFTVYFLEFRFDF